MTNQLTHTFIASTDDCGIISIEAPSSVFDFSVIEQKLNSVMRENKDEKVSYKYVAQLHFHLTFKLHQFSISFCTRMNEC